MFPEHENLEQHQTTPAEETTAPPPSNPPKKKRNCGRTGPTTAAGKRNSSKNALKHGACSRTLILPVESEEGWRILLSRYTDRYQPTEASLEYDIVWRAAQAEWRRLRAQRQYDDFLVSTGGTPPYKWTAEQIKAHDLMLRYCGVAERTVHRENRALDAHFKNHKLHPKPEPTEETISELPPEEEDLFSLGTHEEIQEDILAERTPMPASEPTIPNWQTKPVHPRNPSD